VGTSKVCREVEQFENPRDKPCRERISRENGLHLLCPKNRYPVDQIFGEQLLPHSREERDLQGVTGQDIPREVQDAGAGESGVGEQEIPASPPDLSSFPEEGEGESLKRNPGKFSKRIVTNPDRDKGRANRGDMVPERRCKGEAVPGRSGGRVG